MSGKLYIGSAITPNDPVLARAYCEGRSAAYTGALITANPHPVGSIAYTAWRNGWQTYEAAGTVVSYDNCDRPKKMAARTFSFPVALLVVAASVSPALSVTYDWGDGTWDYDVDGAISHTYAAAGTYPIRIFFQGALFATDSVTVAATE